MKQCFFCPTQIHEYAKACGHCGNSQPSPKEIDREYKKIAVGYAIAGMLINSPLLLPMMMFWFIVIGLLVFFGEPFGLDFSASILLAIIVALIFIFFWVKAKVFRKYLARAVFEYAVEIDNHLHENLKNRKSKTLIRPFVVLVVFIILAISNPSTHEFQAYYAKREESNIELKDVNRINLIICSRYQINEKLYWGVLGNFF